MSETIDTTAFTIIPLSGGVAEISLVATALPFAGVTFGTEQRMKTRYYPGNPVATQTVTGPIKTNTTITGRWMDLSLGDGATRLLIRDIEYLCERGIPVEVRWGGKPAPYGEDPPIVRQGLIKKFDPKYYRTVHAEWSLEFEWRGDALQTAPMTFSASLSPSNDLIDFADSLATAQDTTQGWMETAWSVIGRGTGAMLTIGDALDRVQNAVADATILCNGASDMLQQAAELPSSIVDRIRGMCDAVVYSCWNARATFDCYVGLWAGLTLLPKDGEAWRLASDTFGKQVRQAKLAFLPTDDPLDRIDQQTSAYALVQTWDATAEKAWQIGATYAAKQVPEVIATVRPPAGSDLRDLAIKYYGDPDLWIIIADFGGLDSSEVPATPTVPSEWEAPPIQIPRQTAQSMALVWKEP